MALNLFVIDDAKCLHDLLEVLSEQSVVAPTDHADTTDKYGKGTTTKYGHLMLTNEGQSPGAWTDILTVIGKAVSGSDGYLFNQRIAQNATDIGSLQTAVQNVEELAKLPVGTVVISDAQSASQMAQNMGYGTWLNIKTEQVTSGTTTYYLTYYYRSA